MFVSIIHLTWMLNLEIFTTP